ncbi:Fic/DOC family protein [Herbiconiux ginsengi]|uniref:protein adenylyltransferase n=1 Tax=Herbiconiux ginsengi TaxID=381665 RepID=A0A1H3Q054_9MICO|nr:Fic family protein [Herbiconiux ginsengi]SDZ06435.1 cell filamentation protein [Herbiconiux ginsengi]
MAKGFRTWDDYFIPGTSVLRNVEGITDGDQLRRYEEAQAHVRLVELADAPLPATFDYDHMKAIHRHIFQDVYEWAGEERVGPVGFMSKDGHSYYPAGPTLTEAAHAEYRKLASKDFLRGLDKAAFVDELAERWGELNVIHSFREGNTRTQFVFFSQLAENAGYRIDTDAFRVGSPLRDEFVAARFHSQDTGSNTQLAAVLSKAIEPIDRRPAAPPQLHPELQRIVDLNKLNFPTSATEIRAPEPGSSTPGRGHVPPQQGLSTDYGYGR